ncbi:MAG TPA: hypothetical protein VFW78_07665 [Bacteroidia bacterium]|nr:hypothetical protein [Bacteroidia bacterium]
MNRTLTLVAGFTFMVLSSSFAQVYSNKVVGKKHEAVSDSIKTTEYKYALPIWGQKATALGFDLPYSAGLSVQYLWQRSDLVINNLEIGFNNGPKTNIDEIVRFNNATSKTQGVNFRPDLWIFPFLNIYGIIAKSNSSTSVDFSIYAPDSTGTSQQIFEASTKADFEGTTVGFGLTPTIGVGGGFLAMDMNFGWTDIAALDKPAFSFVFGPRFGKTFKFKKEQSLALWTGAFRIKINSGTSGSLPVDELFDLGGIESKIDNGIVKIDEFQQQVDTWWNGLSALEQQNPVNKVKYETAQRALDSAGSFLGNLDGAVNNAANSTVQYALDKKQKQMWNFIVGSQYQLNKHWMVRAELGFLGSREQFIGGLQYRFGL